MYRLVRAQLNKNMQRRIFLGNARSSGQISFQKLSQKRCWGMLKIRCTSLLALCKSFHSIVSNIFFLIFSIFLIHFPCLRFRCGVRWCEWVWWDSVVSSQHWLYQHNWKFSMSLLCGFLPQLNRAMCGPGWVHVSFAQLSQQCFMY